MCYVVHHPVAANWVKEGCLTQNGLTFLQEFGTGTLRNSAIEPWGTELKGHVVLGTEATRMTIVHAEVVAEEAL